MQPCERSKSLVLEARTRKELEFEHVARLTDVQLTKPFPIGDGDEMTRALFTTTEAIVLTPVGADDIVDSITVTPISYRSQRS